MAGTMPPPTRGRPYYDVARGRKMIVPKEGGKAIPFVGAPEWTPRAALRRAGIRATAAGDRAARRAPRAAFDAAKASGGIPQLGVGQLILYVFVSILALALLENALGGPGSGAVSKILAFLGGTIAKLVSPTDPLVPQGVIPPPVTTSAPASSAAPASTAVSPAVAPGNSVLGLLGSILRVDQGVDFQTVGPVPALASGVVSHVSPIASWAGGTGQAVYVTLDTPVTVKGRTYTQIYYAERLPLVRPGQRVIGGLTPVISQGSNELGFANGNQPASPPVGGIGAGTKPSQAGQDFLAWLKGGKP